VPQQRYFDFLDRTRAKQVVAEGIREAFSELFSINIKANELSADDAKNKLRTLYAGKKTDLVIGNIAKTFSALCQYADFTQSNVEKPATPKTETIPTEEKPKDEKPAASTIRSVEGTVRLDSLQYHINIVLPESRDQAVYDAIFKSLREHLGTRHG
jgi:hypothetical protein